MSDETKCEHGERTAADCYYCVRNASVYGEADRLRRERDTALASLAAARGALERATKHIEKWSATEKHGKCWRESECVFCMNRRALDELRAAAGTPSPGEQTK